LLDVTRNMVATWLAMIHNMLATWVTALFDPTVDGLSCFKSNGRRGIRC
jgi:catabolite regulation protein CreA